MVLFVISTSIEMINRSFEPGEGLRSQARLEAVRALGKCALHSDTAMADRAVAFTQAGRRGRGQFLSKCREERKKAALRFGAEVPRRNPV